MAAPKEFSALNAEEKGRLRDRLERLDELNARPGETPAKIANDAELEKKWLEFKKSTFADGSLSPGFLQDSTNKGGLGFSADELKKLGVLDAEGKPVADYKRDQPPEALVKAVQKKLGMEETGKFDDKTKDKIKAQKQEKWVDSRWSEGAEQDLNKTLVSTAVTKLREELKGDTQINEKNKDRVALYLKTMDEYGTHDRKDAKPNLRSALDQIKDDDERKRLSVKIIAGQKHLPDSLGGIILVLLGALLGVDLRPSTPDQAVVVGEGIPSGATQTNPEVGAGQATPNGRQRAGGVTGTGSPEAAEGAVRGNAPREPAAEGASRQPPAPVRVAPSR